MRLLRLRWSVVSIVETVDRSFRVRMGTGTGTVEESNDATKDTLTHTHRVQYKSDKSITDTGERNMRESYYSIRSSCERGRLCRDGQVDSKLTRVEQDEEKLIHVFV